MNIGLILILRNQQGSFDDLNLIIIMSLWTNSSLTISDLAGAKMSLPPMSCVISTKIKQFVFLEYLAKIYKYDVTRNTCYVTRST